MIDRNNAADDFGIVSPDRVRTILQGILRAAAQKGWTDETLEHASGIKARRIKSYRVEGKEPSLSAALSLAVVLGRPALNVLLSVIGYVARPLEEGDALQPMQMTADALAQLSIIANAAADGRFDHVEEPKCRAAADKIFVILTPISSAGDAA